MWVRLWVVMVVGVVGWWCLVVVVVCLPSFVYCSFWLCTCLLAAVVRCLLRWLLLSLSLSWLSVCLCLCTCPLSLVAVLVGRFGSCLCRSFCWRRSALAGLWLLFCWRFVALALGCSCWRLLVVVFVGGCLRCLLLVVVLGGRRCPFSLLLWSLFFGGCGLWMPFVVPLSVWRFARLCVFVVGGCRLWVAMGCGLCFRVGWFGCPRLLLLFFGGRSVGLVVMGAGVGAFGCVSVAFGGLAFRGLWVVALGVVAFVGG